MEFFKETTIDFMRLKIVAAVFSCAMILASFASFFAYGLHFGLDFTGGTEFQMHFSKTVDLHEVRSALSNTPYSQAAVLSYGANDVLIRIGEVSGVSQKQLTADILKALPDATPQSVSYIGPQVGAELATNGFLALIVALIGTSIYIALRFEYRFAVSAAVALLHDPIVILGIFSFFGIEFDLTALAAVLTVVGYSLNDTIVVFDRVRENFRKLRKQSSEEIVNLSVNQTLSRTIMTSGLTLLAVVSLFFFGGPTVHSFALALIIGIIVGTYSSIYVAGALSVVLGLKRADFLPPTPKEIDERP